MLLERLIDNVGLDVEAFATCRVAQGWRLRLPALDWTTFHYTLDGEGKVAGRGTPAGLSSGFLAVVPPHLVHSLECGAPPFGEASAGDGPAGPSDVPSHQAGPRDEEGLVVACGRVEVTFGGVQGFFDQLREILVLDFAEDPAMRVTFASILEEIRRARPGAQAMMSALMRECLIRVLRRLCSRDDCSIPWLGAADDPTLGPAVEEMLSGPERPHTVASLAARVHMSRSAFARRFRDSTGSPPLEYLRGIRLRHAAGLLRKVPPLSVSTVARRSGFASRSQFSRAFTAHFGCPPSEFRS